MSTLGRYERVTEPACLVLRLANDEAMEFGSKFIQPEHILMALTRPGSGPIASALATLGMLTMRCGPKFDGWLKASRAQSPMRRRCGKSLMPPSKRRMR